MRLDRRSFLTGLGALIAAPAIVRAASLMPVREDIPILWGDLVHDDTAAIQAAVNRMAYRWRGRIQRAIDGETVHLPSASYRLSQTIRVRSSNVRIADSHFEFDRAVGAMIQFDTPIS